MSRLTKLQGDDFDVAVIGGGIIGCGVARDAALRGLRVALVEQRDFGSGTTSASTRIVHGGLRYLEMLDFGLVRMDLRERETLLRIAPHLVRPLEFLVPFFRGDRVSSLKMRAGLAIYDALSFDKSLPSRRWLTAGDARQADRSLNRDDIRGAAAYHDARVDSPERLALENILDAEAHGAIALNYCTAIATSVVNSRVTGIRVRDELDGSETHLTARVVVNATGAWFEQAAARITARHPNRIRTTKGIHIVCRALTDRALVLFSRLDRRLLFAIPRGGLTWIGTTDTDFDGDPASARADRDDVDYLIRSVQPLFPDLTADDVLYTTAGVRALVRQGGAASSVSRMHKIVDGEPVGPPGVMSVLGGKITGYRAIAEEVTDLICHRIDGRVRPSRTAATQLPGARGYEAYQRAVFDNEDKASHLYELYGTRAEGVLAIARSSPEFAQRLSTRYPSIAAQVIFAVRHEHCVRLSDFLRRRTLLGATEDQGLDAAERAAALMALELGWSQQRMADELVAYRQDIDATQQFSGTADAQPNHSDSRPTRHVSRLS